MDSDNNNDNNHNVYIISYGNLTRARDRRKLYLTQYYDYSEYEYEPDEY